MLCSNIWVEIGLVNGALSQVKAIIYNEGEKPPQLYLFVVVHFKHYIGPPSDHNNPNNVPITPLSHGLCHQIPLKMAWALTIHKSKGLTLPRATIDISNIDRQGLTFTTISRILDLQSLRIHLAFAFQRCACMQHNPYVAHQKSKESRLKAMSN